MFEGAMLLLKGPDKIDNRRGLWIRLFEVKGGKLTPSSSASDALEPAILQVMGRDYVRAIGVDPDDGISGWWTRKNVEGQAQ